MLSINVHPGIAADRAETKRIFARAKSLGHKHAIWYSVPQEEIGHVMDVVRGLWGCTRDQERLRKNEDGTFDYEAVYGCEDDGLYGIEDWDGTVVIGPNRRELRRKFPIGARVVVFYQGEHEGIVSRHNKKTLTVKLTRTDTNWLRVRFPWSQVEEYVEVLP
ncbi:MAG: hypothetical protein OCU12_06245 [Methanophagales archaeon]|nr:hypothetical protein [Methanophagales archaeon]